MLHELGNSQDWIKCVQHNRTKLTVVLLESPSDCDPWAIAPFDACPPAKTKANKQKHR
jgi:hypothetical protein